MRRSTSILTPGWVEPLRKKAKISDPGGVQQFNADIWDAVDRDERPNRRHRRLQVKHLDRVLRVGLFHRGGVHRRRSLKSRKLGTS